MKCTIEINVSFVVESLFQEPLHCCWPCVLWLNDTSYATKVAEQLDWKCPVGTLIVNLSGRLISLYIRRCVVRCVGIKGVWLLRSEPHRLPVDCPSDTCQVGAAGQQKSVRFSAPFPALRNATQRSVPQPQCAATAPFRSAAAIG